MASTITELNGIFKLPEKFNVIGLAGFTGLNDETMVHLLLMMIQNWLKLEKNLINLHSCKI